MRDSHFGGSIALRKEGVMVITITADVSPEFVIAVIVALIFRIRTK
jgi:hypothetical protein